MKALSIKQPWAWLIASGYKDIENRIWSTFYKGRIYIHAGKNWDGQAITDLWQGLNGTTSYGLKVDFTKIPFPGYDKIARGAIIGEVDIVDCVCKSASPWFCGPYGFVLANPVLYEKPIPYRGQLGFFEVKEAIHP